jgi:chromosome segregation ATPase
VENLETISKRQGESLGRLHEDVESTLKLLTEAAEHMHSRDALDTNLKARVDVLEDVLNDHQVIITSFKSASESFDSQLGGVRNYIETSANVHEKRSEELSAQCAELRTENRHLKDEMKELKLVLFSLNQKVEAISAQVL